MKTAAIALILLRVITPGGEAALLEVPLALPTANPGAAPVRLTVAQPAGQEAAGHDAAELDRLRTLFKAVKTPATQGKRWVILESGTRVNKGKLRGWLLKDESTRVTVLAEDGSEKILRRASIDKKDSTEGGDGAVVWNVTEGDFVAHCKQVIASQRSPDKIDTSAAEAAATNGFGDPANAVRLARLADWLGQLGDAKLARQMLRAAIGARDQAVATYRLTPGDSLAQFVANQMVADGWRAAIEDAYAGKSRADLLKEYQAMAAIPFHTYTELVKEMQHSYESLIAEDRGWKEPAAKTLEKWTPKQKAVYWLYRLRDLDYKGADSSGACHIVHPWGFHIPDPNPAAELVQLSYAALPEVIAHLDDLRPTRCVESVSWRGAPYLLSYGDCCEQIFSAITGVRLSESGFGEARLSQGAHKVQAERWWREFEKKGEKQVLIEATRAGGSVFEQAQRLAKKYPREAFAALRDGIRATSDDNLRWDLLSIMRRLKDERVADFLGEELKGPFVRTRAGAAMGLWERGQDVGVDRLISEWESFDLRDYERTQYAWGEKHFDHDGLDALVQALAKSCKVKAIRALDKRMAKLPAQLKQSIIAYLGEATKDFAGQPPSAEANAVIDQLLVGCLDDQTKNAHISGGKRDNAGRFRQYAYPRTCDVAAEVLVARWNQRKLFDFFGTVENRDTQLAELKRSWLKKQNREP